MPFCSSFKVSYSVKLIPNETGCLGEILCYVYCAMGSRCWPERRELQCNIHKKKAPFNENLIRYFRLRRITRGHVFFCAPRDQCLTVWWNVLWNGWTRWLGQKDWYEWRSNKSEWISAPIDDTPFSQPCSLSFCSSSLDLLTGDCFKNIFEYSVLCTEVLLHDIGRCLTEIPRELPFFFTFAFVLVCWSVFKRMSASSFDFCVGSGRVFFL